MENPDVILVDQSNDELLELEGHLHDNLREKRDEASRIMRVSNSRILTEIGNAMTEVEGMNNNTEVYLRSLPSNDCVDGLLNELEIAVSGKGGQISDCSVEASMFFIEVTDSVFYDTVSHYARRTVSGFYTTFMAIEMYNPVTQMGQINDYLDYMIQYYQDAWIDTAVTQIQEETESLEYFADMAIRNAASCANLVITQMDEITAQIRQSSEQCELN